MKRRQEESLKQVLKTQASLKNNGGFRNQQRDRRGRGHGHGQGGRGHAHTRRKRKW